MVRYATAGPAGSPWSHRVPCHAGRRRCSV